HKTVEVFRGAVCDNGAPIATVGPHSTADGVDPRCVEGVFIEHGVVASFRVIRHHEGGGGHEGGRDHEGGDDRGDERD
ncbi:hypothetical protein, partial [Saccharothrix sp. ST-888]|uniref:hypothetical protein n=1 Tax=Saccharothrix sp. ST-888 TaxID=1427391 RepID=UPI0005EBF7D4